MSVVTQVWGVGSDDRTVYFRHGVTATEVTGRSWVAVSVQLDCGGITSQSRCEVFLRVLRYHLAISFPSNRWRRSKSLYFTLILVPARSVILVRSRHLPRVQFWTRTFRSHESPRSRATASSLPWCLIALTLLYLRETR